MRGKLFALMGLALALSGCGKESEQAFNAKFDQNFVSSCVSSATKTGVPNELAGKVCGCAIAEINKKYSASEKLALSDSQANPIMAECLRTTVQR